MATITTTRPINPTQLAVELGGVPVRVVGPRQDGTTSVTATGVGAGPLTTAVNAHVAQAVVPDTTSATNAATLQSRASSALTANDTFLAIGSPSNAQTLAQVQLLTKECSALIRLLLGRLETTAGT